MSPTESESMQRIDTARAKFEAELADWTRAQSDLSVTIEDLKTTIVRDVVPLLIDLVKIGTDTLDVSHAVVETAKETLKLAKTNLSLFPNIIVSASIDRYFPDLSTNSSIPP